MLISQDVVTSNFNMAMSTLNIFFVVIATFSQTTSLTVAKHRWKTRRLATFNTGLLPAVTPEVAERTALLGTEVRVCPQDHSGVQTHTHTHMYAHTHTHTHTHTTHTQHTHTQTNTHTQSNKQTHTHNQTNKHTHTHKRTSAYRMAGDFRGGLIFVVFGGRPAVTKISSPLYGTGAYSTGAWCNEQLRTRRDYNEETKENF